MLEKNKESWEIEFDKKFDWKDCGDFKISLDNQTVRPCYKCGFDTMFCKNCANDHHIENRDKCIKQWIYSTLSNQRSEIVEKIIGEIGAKLLAKHSPQVALDAYFEVANEYLEKYEENN